MLSPTTTADLIRSWKRARLSRDLEALGLPRISVLGRVVELGVGGVASLRESGWKPSTWAEEGDAEVVQRAVEGMPPELRTAFEAYHLALIRSEWCTDLPHTARAITIGISRSTYFLRVKAATDRLARDLEGVLAS